MSKDKILHVSYGGIGSGGVAAVILSIVQCLYQDFDFHCIVFRTRANKELVFEKYGKLHRINCYYNKGLGKVLDILLRPFKMTFECYNICKREGIRTIHCHNGYEEAYFLLGAKLAGVKKRIAHSHNTNSPITHSFLKRTLNKIHRYLIDKLATQKIGCSQQACDDFFQTNNTQVIYNAIDFDKFKWRRIDHDKLTFVNVGRYCKQKNQSFVIDIFGELLKLHPDSILKLVGFGEDEQYLKKLVFEKKLDANVIFINGQNANIPDIYAQADLMIFPSIFEGFGIALIEAQASGCFVFSSDVVPTVTDVGLMKTISLDKSAKFWAQSISDKIPELKECKYDNVKERISKFDINVIKKQYKDIYEQQ